MRLDDHLCLCFRIPKRKVLNFTRRERPRHASQISECLGAGTGCGWCIPAILKIHSAVLAGDGAASELADAGPDAADWASERQRYLEAVRAGERPRNSLRESSAPPSSSTPPAPTASPRERAAPPADEDWDVSDYFSRPATRDPEPDDLEED